MSKVYNHETGKQVKVDGKPGKAVIKFIRDNGLDEYVDRLNSKLASQGKEPLSMEQIESGLPFFLRPEAIPAA